MTDALAEERLVSRLPGIPLNDEGRRQVERLAKELELRDITAMYSGPLERSKETADIIGNAIGLGHQELDAINEIEFGSWTGKTIAELRGDEEWTRFHHLRSCLSPPGGESFLDMQARLVPTFMELRDEHDGEKLALVTHADVIKAALAHFGGIPLDLITRYEIAPASMTTVVVGDDWVKIENVNVTFS